MPKRTGEPNTKASGRTDHHEKLKLYTKICVNLGVDEDKVSQKQAEKKLVEYVQRKEAKLPADDPISCLLVEVTEYIINCWRVQEDNARLKQEGKPGTREGIHKPEMMKKIRLLTMLTSMPTDVYVEHVEENSELSRKHLALLLQAKGKKVQTLENENQMLKLKIMQMLQAPLVHSPSLDPHIKSEGEDVKMAGNDSFEEKKILDQLLSMPAPALPEMEQQIADSVRDLAAPGWGI